jgi:ADP-heptose:LPS heptosyltransferase
MDCRDTPIAVLVDREGLGDALLKLPFLRAIKRGFPERPIWWIATHQTAMEDELKPFVSGLITRVISHAGLTTPIRAAIPRLRRLPPFAQVFDMRTRVGSVLAAKWTLKHHGFYACLPGYLLSDRRPPGRWIRPKGIGERALSLAEAALAGPVDWRGRLDVSAAAQRLAAARLPDGAVYVGLATGSREPRKNWPLDRYITLADMLAASGVRPVFFSGPQERDSVDRLRRALPAALFPQIEPVPDDVGALEFAVAIGRRLAAAVANDSGIGHLLGAVGVPLVSLFGPTDPRRWAPLTAHGTVIRAQDFGGETMEAIGADAVADAVRRLIAG